MSSDVKEQVKDNLMKAKKLVRQAEVSESS
jgi:hypothetical protein